MAMQIDPKSEPHASSAGSEDPDGDSEYVEYGNFDDLRTTSIFSSISTLFLSDKWSDMVIRCGGREFKAHRAIVCSQSSFFDKALTSGFSETTTGIIDLPEDNPNVFARFLEFLYRGNYDEWDNGSTSKPAETSMMEPQEVADLLQEAPGTVSLPISAAGKPTESNYSSAFASDGEPIVPSEPDIEYDEHREPSEADSNVSETQAAGRSLRDVSNDADADWVKTLHNQPSRFFVPMRLYFMADKYDVPALKLLARDRFYRAAEASWQHADCFPDVVDELYSCTPDTDVAIREIVCRLVGTAITGIDQRERMDAVMRKHGEFAVDVMKFMLRNGQLVWT